MQVGLYNLDVVETGCFALDGGSMFGVVPRVLWCKGNPSDDKNRIDMALRTLLIRGNGKTVLVDTGIGHKFSPKLVDIYKVDHSSRTLEGSLKSLNVSLSDITDVIVTHLHFDHCGGCTYYKGKELKPTFPNAKYWIQNKQWEWGNNPTEKDKASFIDENFTSLKQWGCLELTDGEFQFLPGIDILVTKGHTPGHQLVKISDGKNTVVYAGDTVPMSNHVQIPWNMAYDNEPLITMKEKRALLQKAVLEDWIIIFEHDPFMIGATIACENERFKIRNKITTFAELSVTFQQSCEMFNERKSCSP